MESKKLGVIGGLGPMATAVFLEMVVEMTDADVDQEHIEMLIHHCPQIPDRTSYILGNSSENPEIKMIEVEKELERQGAEMIVIPCVTSTYFWKELSGAVDIPVLNIVEELHKYFKQRNVHSVGLMATSGTVESGLFQKAFAGENCRLILPSKERQQDVMHLIYNNIKANKPAEMERFAAVSEELREQGAEVIILGCTELSVLHKNHEIGAGYLDAMQLMAKCAVESCGRLKIEYQELITGREVKE